jgi:hypothetical protein
MIRRREFITLLGGASAAAWPPALYAQQADRSYRIGFLALVPGEDATLMKALLERLHELGYSERTNMTFKYRSAEGRPERLAPLAMELVQDRPDVLIAGFGTLAAQAAKAATTTIPVVFTTVGDPLGAGIIASLARPGGNVTGLTDRRETFKASGCSFFASSSRVNPTLRCCSTRTRLTRGWRSRKPRQRPNTGIFALRFSKLEHLMKSREGWKKLEDRPPACLFSKIR